MVLTDGTQSVVWYCSSQFPNEVAKVIDDIGEITDDDKVNDELYYGESDSDVSDESDDDYDEQVFQTCLQSNDALVC